MEIIQTETNRGNKAILVEGILLIPKEKCSEKWRHCVCM